MIPCYLLGLVLIALLPSSLSHRLDVLAGDTDTVVAGVGEQQLSGLSWAFSLEQVAWEQKLTLLRTGDTYWLKPGVQDPAGLDFLLSHLPRDLFGRELALECFPPKVQSWVVERLAEEESSILHSERLFLKVEYAPYVVVREGDEVLERVFLQPRGALRLHMLPLAEEGKVYRTAAGSVVFFGRMPNLQALTFYASHVHTPVAKQWLQYAAHRFESPFFGVSERVKFVYSDLSPAQRETLFAEMGYDALPEYTYEFIPNFQVSVRADDVPLVRKFNLR